MAPVLLLGMASIAVLWMHSAAEHTAALRWMQGYKGADGVGCCSEHDCLPWPVAVLQHTGDQATVRMGETVVQLPAKSVHATQDGQTYMCRIYVSRACDPLGASDREKLGQTIVPTCRTAPSLLE